MSDLACCEASSWQLEIDLDRAGGYELALGRCSACGTKWMSVYCAGSGVSGYEPVSPSDAERMSTLPAGPERRTFMKAWVESNI